MIKEFKELSGRILHLLEEWEGKLAAIPHDNLQHKTNSQNRTIKQILGHMIDSASNNIHRIVHLQYRVSPVDFPNYATLGNNDRWIAIQNYQEENWAHMVQLWKYMHLHIIHVISNIDPGKLDAVWNDNTGHGQVSLQDMVTDFPRHFELHLAEIDDLLKL